jgi:hypothetical protein
MDIFSRIPSWVWIGGAALLAYLYFSRSSSASSSGKPLTGGGGGTITTGNTRINKDAINISVMMDGQGTGQKQPSPTGGDTTKQITVPKDETLGALAKYLHWSKDTLAQVEELNAVGGQELTAASKLHKGQTIVRPVEGNY